MEKRIPDSPWELLTTLWWIRRPSCPWGVDCVCERSRGPTSSRVIRGRGRACGECPLRRGKAFRSFPSASMRERASERPLSSAGLWVGTGCQRRAACRQAISRATARLEFAPFSFARLANAPMLSPNNAKGESGGGPKLQRDKARDELPQTLAIGAPHGGVKAFQGGGVPHACCPMGDSPVVSADGPQPQGQASSETPIGPAMRSGMGDGETTRRRGSMAP